MRNNDIRHVRFSLLHLNRTKRKKSKTLRDKLYKEKLRENMLENKTSFCFPKRVFVCVCMLAEVVRLRLSHQNHSSMPHRIRWLHSGFGDFDIV